MPPCSIIWSMRCSAPRDVLELTPSGISHATRVRALIQAIAWYTSSRCGKVRDDRRRVNLPARPSQTRPRARCGIIRLCTRVLDHVVDALQSSARRARRADSGDCIVDSHAESLVPLGYASGADFAASLGSHRSSPGRARRVIWTRCETTLIKRRSRLHLLLFLAVD